MNDDRFKELMKELADKKLELEKMVEDNPLMEYSTTELKAELRRRKRGD